MLFPNLEQISTVSKAHLSTMHLNEVNTAVT